MGFLGAVVVAGVLADRPGAEPWTPGSAGGASGAQRIGVVRVSATVAAAGCVALWAGLDLPGVVVLAAVAAGAGEGGCRPAFQALVADLVAPADRRRANAAITIAVRVTVLAGPALAAAGAAVADVRVLLLAPAVLWLAAALAPASSARADAPLPRAGLRRRCGGIARGLVDGYREGLAEARRHPWFLTGLGALAATIAVGYASTSVVLPLVSRERTGGAGLLAACVTAYTAGALLGALVVARRTPRSEGWSALAGLAAYALGPLALLLEAPVAVCVAAYAAVGVGIEAFNVPWFTATQREVAPDRLARVSALDLLVAYGLAPLGLALMPAALAAHGPGPVLAVTVAVCLLGPLAAAAAPGARHFASR